MISQLVSRLKSLALSVGVVSVAGVILAGCSLEANSNPTTTQAPIQPTVTTVQATLSPDQAMTKETDNLNQLDQDAAAVDKSFNDQAINVMNNY